MLSVAREQTSAGTLPAARAFQLQYISLIMIILTFIIGGFTRRHLPSISSASTTAPDRVVEVQPNWLHSTLQLNDLFIADTTTLNLMRADAIVEFLSNHDIDCTVEIASPTDLRVAIQRAAELDDYFIRQGLPIGSARVYAVRDYTRPPDYQARIRWAHSGLVPWEATHGH